MSLASTSIHSESANTRGGRPAVWQSSDGQLHVEAHITSQASSETSPLVNTRFQGGRAGLLTAVSLASLMGATAAHGQDSVQLPTIDVSGEQSGGYQATETSLVRLPTPVRDTPQTVNVVTEQLIKDQRANTVIEALRNVSGITFNAGEGGTQGDNINIRGYTARNDFYRDGVRDPGWYTRDVFSLEQVEVLKGPSSFLFGRGSTGGVVNLTSKLPKDKDHVDIEGSASSAPGGRITADFNKVWNENVATRLVVLETKTGVAGRDGTETNRQGIAPSVAVKLNDSTKATLAYIYQHDNNIPDYGIPMLPGSYFGSPVGGPMPVPRNTYYQVLSGPLSDYEKFDVHIGTLKIEHDITKDIKLTNTTRYLNVNRDTRVRGIQLSATNIFNASTGGTAGYPPAGADLNNYWVQNTNHFQNNTINTLLANQTDLVAKFATAGLQHTAVAGVELSRETRDHYRATITGDSRVNLGSPSSDPTNPGVVGVTALTSGQATTQAAYIADQVKITKFLELLGGLRYDRFAATQDSSTATAGLSSLSSTNYFLSYRIGVVVHPTDNSSLYYMHGTSANPPADFVTLTTGQQSLQPVKNNTHEIGVKVDVLDGKLSLTGAVFRTTQENAYENLGTSAAPNYVAVGTTRVQGVEVGAVGRITREWNVTLGYTYLDSRVLESITTANIEHRLANTPEHSGSLFTTYDVTPKWTVGGGAYYVGNRFTSTANSFAAPGYWRFDAMTSYKVTDNFLLQLNVYNIADTTNYESLAGAGWAVPGVSRSFMLTGRYHW